MIGVVAHSHASTSSCFFVVEFLIVKTYVCAPVLIWRLSRETRHFHLGWVEWVTTVGFRYVSSILHGVFSAQLSSITFQHILVLVPAPVIPSQVISTTPHKIQFQVKYTPTQTKHEVYFQPCPCGWHRGRRFGCRIRPTTKSKIVAPTKSQEEHRWPCQVPGTTETLSNIRHLQSSFRYEL